MAMKTRTIVATMASMGILGGCVSQQTQDVLDITKRACVAGAQRACTDLPAIEAQADAERRQSAILVGATIIAIPVILAAVAGPDPGPRFAGPPPRQGPPRGQQQPPPRHP